MLWTYAYDETGLPLVHILPNSMSLREDVTVYGHS